MGDIYSPILTIERSADIPNISNTTNTLVKAEGGCDLTIISLKLVDLRLWIKLVDYNIMKKKKRYKAEALYLLKMHVPVPSC